MYQKSYTKKFEKNLKKFIKSGKILREEVENIIDALANDKNLNIAFMIMHYRANTLDIVNVTYDQTLFSYTA